ncbi:MAG: hypothetical protein WCL61_02290 [bacterium]
MQENHRKIWRVFFSLAVVTIIFHLQMSFFSNLGGFWHYLNLVLCLIILTVNLFDYSAGLLVGLWLGFLADIYSNLPFGFFMLVYFSTAMILALLHHNFFTNRSMYSLLSLGLIGAVVYNLLFLATSGLFYLLRLSDFFSARAWLADTIGQAITSTLLLLVVFYFINRHTRSFKPIFIQS